MTERDKKLIEEAKRSRWEDINPDIADTQEAKTEIYSIMRRKYFRDEFNL